MTKGGTVGTVNILHMPCFIGWFCVVKMEIILDILSRYSIRVYNFTDNDIFFFF